MLQCRCSQLRQQRKTEDEEPVEDGADEAKKAKPSEEVNGEGDQPNEKDAEADEQPSVSEKSTDSFMLNWNIE